MLYTQSRIDNITRYLAEYSTIIRLGNDAGLFDNAKLYELFAQEVCRVWFGKQFNNLNSVNNNFPYVDLVSDDGNTYVQVSTAENLNKKIKDTLDKIANTSDERFWHITEVYFFTLDPDAKRVRSCSVETQSGNVVFIPEKHLITSSRLLDRAKNDLEFQIKIDELFKADRMHTTRLEDDFKAAVETSKLKMEEIVSLLNREYEIDRSKLIEQIRQEDKQYILIDGDFGVGKSAFCKMLVRDEELVLYARADTLGEYRSINELWGFHIENLLFLLGEKRVYFIIDALEFLVDGGIQGKTNLRQLYQVTAAFKNAVVITSCRTSQKESLLSIFSKYDVSAYQLHNLTWVELMEISSHYPVVKSMMESNAYRQILHNPFYLNMIISELKNVDDIHDENELRRMIWRDVICLGRDLPVGISSLDVKTAVKKIVFERAIRFISGISEDEIDNRICERLLSREIIVSFNHKIRLKYDIFEDICFEIEFENLFDACRGDYPAFFRKIEIFGRCRYRRYQIWVENKLYERDDRDRIISEIVFDKTVSTTWREQTIIGIVRSKYSRDFIHENEERLYSTGLYVEVLRILNLNAFEINIHKLAAGDTYTSIKPVGRCRNSMIRYAHKYRLMEKSELALQLILLLSDYSKQVDVQDRDTVDISGEILEYYIDLNWKAALTATHAENTAAIMACVRTLYSMAEYTEARIDALWGKIKDDYLQDNHNRRHRVARDILEATILNPPVQLTRFMPEKLCELASLYWLEIPQEKNREKSEIYPLEYEILHNSFQLNRNARSYQQKISSPEESVFMQQILEEHFWAGLDWGIYLINTLVSQFVKVNPEEVIDTQIYFPGREIRHYYGNPKFWLTCTEYSNLPKLISDFVYLLIQQASKILSDDGISHESRRDYAMRLKETIYSKSNNSILLRVIADIGIQFSKLLPGYAVDLISNLYLVRWDNQFYLNIHPTEMIQKLNQDSLLSVGIPKMKERYNITRKTQLLNYALLLQLSDNPELSKQVYIILDRLYEETEDTAENAEERLLIQKMDSRTYEREVDGTGIVLTPRITGTAACLVEAYEASPGRIEDKKLDDLILDLHGKLLNGELSLPDLLSVITSLQNEFHEDALKPQITEISIQLIAAALSNNELDTEKRSELCEYWINGIEAIFQFRVFRFERKLCWVLFQQTEKALLPQTCKNLRQLIIQLICSDQQHGLINDIRSVLEKYLRQNHALAEEVFAAVVALARDREYNDIDLNCQITEIQQFLNGDATVDIENISFEGCSVPVLSFSFRCGLKLEHPQFRHMAQFVLHNLLIEWKKARSVYRDDLWTTRSNLQTYIGICVQEMEETEEVVSLLFDDSNIAYFTKESVNFYIDTLSWVTSTYFDAHEDPEKRRKCELLIDALEKAILKVSDPTMQKELTKVLFLKPWRITRDQLRELKTSYSYSNKEFLNRLWTKYGAQHVAAFLQMVFQFKISELLPDVLKSVAHVFELCNRNPEAFLQVIYSNYYYINAIITQADIDFRDQIKQDVELTKAYEKILSILSNFNFREAGVLANDFRLH